MYIYIDFIVLFSDYFSYNLILLGDFYSFFGGT
jgi:hypothetical protein